MEAPRTEWQLRSTLNHRTKSMISKYLINTAHTFLLAYSSDSIDCTLSPVKSTVSLTRLALTIVILAIDPLDFGTRQNFLYNQYKHYISGHLPLLTIVPLFRDRPSCTFVIDSNN